MGLLNLFGPDPQTADDPYADVNGSQGLFSKFRDDPGFALQQIGATLSGLAYGKVPDLTATQVQHDYLMRERREKNRTLKMAQRLEDKMRASGNNDLADLIHADPTLAHDIMGKKVTNMFDPEAQFTQRMLGFDPFNGGFGQTGQQGQQGQPNANPAFGENSGPGTPTNINPLVGDQQTAATTQGQTGQPTSSLGGYTFPKSVLDNIKAANPSMDLNDLEAQQIALATLHGGPNGMYQGVQQVIQNRRYAESADSLQATRQLAADKANAIEQLAQQAEEAGNQPLADAMRADPSVAIRYMLEQNKPEAQTYKEVFSDLKPEDITPEKAAEIGNTLGLPDATPDEVRRIKAGGATHVNEQVDKLLKERTDAANKKIAQDQADTKTNILHDQFNTTKAFEFRKEINAQAKLYQPVFDAADLAVQALAMPPGSEDTGPAQVAALSRFMAAVDPKTGITAGDRNVAQAAQSYIELAQAKIAKLTGGSGVLSPGELKDLRKETIKIARLAESHIREIRKDAYQTAKDAGFGDSQLTIITGSGFDPEKFTSKYPDVSEPEAGFEVH